MEQTPKNFVLQLGSLISLYVSIGALIALLFAIINTAYPDLSIDAYYADYGNTIRGTIATLIIVFPTYLILTRIVNQKRRTDAQSYGFVTRWLIYLSLLVGGGVLLGDLIALLWNYLNGELTVRFVLKALTVFVVVGAAFAYYLLDVRQFWHTRVRESIMCGVGATIIVIAAIVFGFMNTASPAEVRERTIDERTIEQLMSIESSIQYFYDIEGALPGSLEKAYQALGRGSAPVPLENREPYTYAVLGDTTYELCADFAFASNEHMRSWFGVSWDHGAGRHCFKRVVMDTKF